MSKHAATYPAEEQYEQWKAAAEEMGTTVSEWIEIMVEAGQKEFTRYAEQANSVEGIRKERNEIRSELENARDRIRTLERQLYRGERGAIIEFIENNPGVTKTDIQKELTATMGSRVETHMTQLEGIEVEKIGDEYHPIEDE